MSNYNTHADVILIGAGIMSATLGTLLKMLDPEVRITILERLDAAAAESSDAWNNAGTGHSAFCELNYTPEDADGTVRIDKALKICASFEESKQFWTYLVNSGAITHPEGFLRQVPHIAYVWGNKDTEFLRKRYEALVKSPLFEGMEYTEDPETMKAWMPLVMTGLGQGEHADAKDRRAATRMEIGTDVNFGALTRGMIGWLTRQPGVRIQYGADVKAISRDQSNSWFIEVKDAHGGESSAYVAHFVFIGAGGGALPLLLKSGIPEGRHFGGFPVSGQWLRCTNPEVIARHYAKVYGKAAVGAPPMSVPHLDTRFIDGEKALLFGPFAGFSTRFLKHGALSDLPRSLRWSNLRPMIMAGLHNIPLTRYLIGQVVQSADDRIKALRDYLPTAQKEDWELLTAGQRVQVIRKDDEEGGVLEFGTEVVASADGSLAALLGASPGASTAVSIMLEVLKTCFPQKADEWEPKLRNMIPSYGLSLQNDRALLRTVRERSGEVLHIRAHQA